MHLLTLFKILSPGNIYVSDKENLRVRKIDASTSKIATIAGTGTASFSGDGGQATSASLQYPIGVAVDNAGKHFEVFSLQRV